jgi:hypothetical protein
MNPDTHEGQTVPASIRHPSCYSYIYIVMANKSLVADRGKKKSTYKGKDPLSFEIWIFRNFSFFSQNFTLKNFQC